MRDSVRAAFLDFSKPLEGCMSCVYLDTHNPPLVTTGVGNMLPNLAAMLDLPWRLRTTGAAATQADIVNEWNRVTAATSHSHDSSDYWIRTAALHLLPNDIATLVASKAEEFAEGLSAYPQFNRFEQWPADAQLGILSMGWAMGDADFMEFPHFRAACAVQDWKTAAAECAMDATHNPGLVPRNKANHQLFLNAAIVKEKGLDPSKLYYPYIPD